jgi:hypothetical protein
MKFTKEFIEALFILGTEIIEKDKPTIAEQNFLKQLDVLLEKIEVL